MTSRHLGRFAMFLPLALLLLALIGFVVMGLWNALLPPLFGWKTIGYWQAWGLLLLARILFGGLHGGGSRGGHWRHRMKERWQRMTPEERERFRQELDGGRVRTTTPAESEPGA
jgi:hypothetical protein